MSMVKCGNVIHLVSSIFTKFQNLKLEEHFSCLLEFYMPWSNESELKQTTKVVKIDTKRLNMIFCVI